MPTSLTVKNVQSSQQQRPVRMWGMPGLSKLYGGQVSMTAAPAFCRHYGDLDGCRRMLVETWNLEHFTPTKTKDSGSEHCIIKGLRFNLQQCREVLKEGLYRQSVPDESGATDPAVLQQELAGICKEVVLFGYPQEISAVQKVFYEAYYRLVRSIIHKYGINDEGEPSADDVSQTTFKILHDLLREGKGRSIKGPFAPYVVAVVSNECKRAKRSLKGHAALPDEVQLEQRQSTFGVFVTRGVAEIWEDINHQLLNSGRGDLINRIILAHRVIEGSTTGRKPSAKELMEYWRLLSDMSTEEVADIHSLVVAETTKGDFEGVTFVAANLLNTGGAEMHQLAIVLAAGTGMDIEQIRRFIGELNGLSAGAIFTRISRIYDVLQPPEEEEK